MTARATFKQSDIERACKGAIAAGLKVDTVEVEGGRIVIRVADEAANGNKRMLDRLHAA